MSRWLRALVIVLLAASCGGGGGSGQSPGNLDDACSILNQRPQYIRAFRATERKWGVPVHVQMATIYQESKFKSDARTPFRYALGVIPYGRQSSAFGYSQALDGTWEEYLTATGKRGAQRDDIRDATDFMGWYMAGSRDRLGISLRDARNQYLAYHEGRTGFKRGTYNSKAWLLRVADEVGDRAVVYEVQLANCRAARR
ncbi:lytic transglycosylase [Salipiger sp. P9]|uniref:transglycosylase SLT domain-containing protein n=1 Tax=Salipiger pentaromativorans TaxID=2943193 RepID=UPI002157D922|nr:lytic transglycosylase [Salipiger pentaromativorans]MCR8547950.1 lytic transglycosylase [Salipiger pentaromativorans]